MDCHPALFFDGRFFCPLPLCAACNWSRHLLKKGVLFGRKNKEPERFYLLPGQGGKNFQRKQKVFLIWTVIVAVIFGGLLSLLMWWFTRLNH